MKLSRTIVPLGAAILITAALVACSGGSGATPSSSSASDSTPKPTKSAEAAAASGDFTVPSWAKPVTNPGTLLTTITGTNFTVDIYQVGTDVATKTGQFADPDTNKPILDVGDPIVYVNYVVTNTGKDDIPLGYSLATVTARYADWKYLQGMDSIVDSALDTKMNINSSALAVGVPDAPFVFEPGQSFSFGENFKYQQDSAITFTATLTPVDASGDLVHDKRQEIKADSTIK